MGPGRGSRRHSATANGKRKKRKRMGVEAVAPTAVKSSSSLDMKGAGKDETARHGTRGKVSHVRDTERAGAHLSGEQKRSSFPGETRTGKQTATQELLGRRERGQGRPPEERAERRLKTRIQIPKTGLNLRNSHEILKRQKVTGHNRTASRTHKWLQKDEY